jgi:tyrosine-protein phosphatase SIW14
MIMSPLLRIGAGPVIFVLLMSPKLPAAQSSPSPSTPIMRSAYGNKLKLPGLPNGGHINDNLYRGAQPHSEGLQELKKLGITTIVDLRGENPQLGESERQQAEKLGIRFVNIPVSGWAPPSNEQVAQFLSIFRNNPNERVFVHCRFGDDRTGVFVATYRMAYENWPAEQAMNEMYYFGFNGFWHPSMKAFIRDFPARLKTAPALVEYRHSDPIVTKCNNPAGDRACSN